MWTEFYARNRNDGGPIQTLFETNVAAMARKTEGHLNKVARLTANHHTTSECNSKQHSICWNCSPVTEPRW
jgi:hypothetical protein